VLDPLKEGRIDDGIGKIIEEVAADTIKIINS
jgi:F-type H+-transporting ATPase subunit alpha